MWADLPILSILTYLPLIGVAFLLINRQAGVASVRLTAFWVSTVTFILSVSMALGYDGRAGGFQYVEQSTWIDGLNIGYHIGVDGLSLTLILLTNLLVPICILLSGSMTARIRELMIAFLVLQTLLIGVFSALDFVLFYIFFEAGLIPMFLIIGIWGGDNRIYAATKFFLYTLLGSLLMLVAGIVLYHQTGTTDIIALSDTAIDPGLQKWLWWAFVASFAVKLPMWPLHTWLPDAHVEAPTPGSIILAGVLLKLGGYGFLRLLLPILPAASLYFAPVMLILSVIAIIYASLVALSQTDMKKIIAYSSVAHMGFVTLGIFSLNLYGLQGAIMQMISHGLISAALFAGVGVLYDRSHSRDIAKYGAVAAKMPLFSLLFMVLTLGSVALPGTSGFVGEFLSLLAAFEVNVILAVFAATGMVLGASYMLFLYRAVFFGPGGEASENLSRLTAVEAVCLTIPAALVVFIGVQPQFILDLTEPVSREILIPFLDHGLMLASAGGES
jgi:NADH-quinone oxidoreductase subunit M